MFKVGDILELKIEKMVYEGFGLARHNDFTVFVEDVCVGDFVEAKISRVKKHCAFATRQKIIETSKYRVKPFCPIHNACGGCQWQYIDYDKQLEIKKNIVEEILSKNLHREIEVQKTLPSPYIKEFRHKIQFPVSQTKNSKRFLIGYYRKNSHEIVNVKFCPIQPKIIDKITEKIRTAAQDYGVIAYNEKTGKGELRHIIFRISENNGDILVCFVVNNDNISKQINDLAQHLFREFSQIIGVSVNFNTMKNNVILGRKTQNLYGEENYVEKIGDVNYVISPESFFQINPKSFKNILDKVRELILERIKKPITILDAYSGVGSFGLYLSDVASKITCVEEVKSACKNAQKACELNGISNVEIINGDAQKIFEQQIKENKKFDVVILDPPRKGCSDESIDYCTKLADKFIVYISCNPNSLARDLIKLEEKGFKLTFTQPADMFCHTYHVETITVVEKL